MSLIPNKGMGKYLVYALGEIVLVVLGILIALSINNWNEERKETQRLRSILQILADDLENDLENVEEILEYYEGYRDEFIALMEGTMTLAQFQACKQCAYLVTGHRAFTIERRGYEALKEFYSGYQEDALVNETVQFYTASIDELATIDNLIRESIVKDLVKWRDQYDWFPEFARQVESPGYNQYAVSSVEFRNMTAWRYALIYTNYVGAAQTFRDGLLKVKEDISQRLGT